MLRAPKIILSIVKNNLDQLNEINVSMASSRMGRIAKQPSGFCYYAVGIETLARSLETAAVREPSGFGNHAVGLRNAGSRNGSFHLLVVTPRLAVEQLSTLGPRSGRKIALVFSPWQPRWILRKPNIISPRVAESLLLTLPACS